MCKLIKNVYFCNSLITVLIKIMINRVLIRLKIIQIVYAYYQNGSKNLDSAEKELFFSLSKAYDLYNYLLMLMIALTEYAQKRIDAFPNGHADHLPKSIAKNLRVYKMIKIT